MKNSRHFLIVVDVQNDFITGALKNDDAVKVLPNICKAIENHHGPIIATMDTHLLCKSNCLEFKTIGIKHCIYDTAGWYMPSSVEKALSKQGSYIGYVKKHTFGSTELSSVIENIESSMKIADNDNDMLTYYDNMTDEKYYPEFTIIGLDTDICVISNALILRAEFPESQIRVLSNCCAGTTPEKHKAALLVMSSCNIKIEELK